MGPEELAQWVIDNRYPKSENDKVSDAEMYHTIIEKINQVLLLGAVSSSATIFEVELYRFINKHVKDGLSKPDLISKMKYVLKSCEMS
jgi:hypothetical protein